MRFARRGFLAAVPLALALGGHARAQEVSKEIVDATVGEWLIASEDGSLGCYVTLEKGKTIGGRVVTEGKTCGAPWHDAIAAWEFSDPGIVLRDATRKALIGFQEQEGGPWKTPLDVSPTVYFIPEPGSMDRVPTVKDAIGKWVLRDDKGKALCHMALLDVNSKRLDDAKTVELAKDCAASVKKTKVDAWQISEIELVIIGGEDWVYTMTPEKDGFVSDDGKFRMRRDQ
ncbi:AprI/Inh family metalloprotease inhibitor [Rhizobium sp. S152]|uniref:AprI/Inh family metalloprotease inhibitor n=1 Tax=Rhizobium sp. S152 TaxID=3055038 RepID=UPI0025A9A2A5|nr:AprI/Inh family metalloprotease inhibitor [Rhizobium sp. S152]MDM9627379.1 AprI/Inh family metalloprotease inhibitor [Rhizobium sp. S152]